MRGAFMLSILVATAAAKPPHLVFILVDDMGYNDFYSSTDISGAWQNVQQLAHERCIDVAQYYTQQMCTPTRGAFLSGRYPVRLGLQHGAIGGAQNFGLPLDEVTLADKLKAAGYNTVGIGKWHLGMYNDASTPTRRGFNHFFGYYNGAEDYFTHDCGGYLDLHDDEVTRFDFNGTYSMDMFLENAVFRIKEHASKQLEETPLFLYLPFQNVHLPLQAKDEHMEAEPCASITDVTRKIFCGNARAADQAVGNITLQMDALFPDDDIIVVISGDNGGMPFDGGNNCPEYWKDGLCLRGHKQELYEGGVRNHALLCSKSMVPDAMKGETYSKGLMHVTDWHATLRDLAGASDKGSKAIDGMNMFEAITSNSESPRKEFLVNIDPCSGHGACKEKDVAYRFNGCVGDACGDWKYHEVPTATGWKSSGWFPPVMNYQCSGKGGCQDPSSFSGEGMPSAYESSSADTGCQLHDLGLDPNEERNLAAAYPEVVAELQARIAAIEEGDDILPPCNVPDGSCNSDDPNAAAVFAENGNAWVPWVADSADAVV